MDVGVILPDQSGKSFVPILIVVGSEKRSGIPQKSLTPASSQLMLYQLHTVDLILHVDCEM